MDSTAKRGSDCAHCELPLGRWFATATVDGVRARFCCYGCVLAHQVTRAGGEPGVAAAILVRLGLAVFCAMNVMAFSLPTYGVYLYGHEAMPADGALLQILRVLSAAFALPVLLLLGAPVIGAAGKGLRAGTLTADALIVIGAFAAYGVSLANLWQGSGEVYFDTASMLLVIVTIGRYLEAKTKADASALVKATFLPVATEALRLDDGISRTVPAEQLCAGDVVRVTPGEGFPTDGVVLQGQGSVDESLLTGESVPLRKVAGAHVAGGTCSVDGTFEVLVTARRAESATARIAALLSGALRQRGETERLADAAARFFVPVIVALAGATGVGWGLSRGFDAGVLASLSVLVVACPCAFGIATPVALWMGLLAAARRGVIVRSAAALERAAGISHVFFDKTGTLTRHKPVLSEVSIAPGRLWTPEAALAAAAALEADLKHPIARALTAAAARRSIPTSKRVSDLQVIPGAGVRGVVDGTPLEIARVDGLRQGSSPAPAEAPSTTAALRDSGGLIATFSFAEELRPSAAAAMARLQTDAIGVGVLSGDRDLRALAGVVEPDAGHSGLTPEAKLQVIQQRRSAERVAMVGDGFNDAPALAAADLGIAVGAAVDLTRVTADVLVLGGDLRSVAWLFEHARRVRRVMLENLAWAVAYNGIAVVLAIVGKLTPVVAAVVMVISSLLVVANSRRLARAPGARGPFSQPCEEQPRGFSDIPIHRSAAAPRDARLERHAP